MNERSPPRTIGRGWCPKKTDCFYWNLLVEMPYLCGNAIFSEAGAASNVFHATRHINQA